MHPLLVAAMLLLSAASTRAEPVSGRYGPLALVVRNATVSGVFSAVRQGNGTPDAPQFSCIFLLGGPLAGEKAAVETWYPGSPERIPGTLDFTGADAALTLREDQDGCPMAIGGMVREPFTESLEERKADWIDVGLVTAERSVLHSCPEVSPAQKPYLVRWDAVAVRERKAGWARVEYLGSEKPVTGWLRLSDIATASPTAR